MLIRFGGAARIDGLPDTVAATYRQPLPNCVTYQYLGIILDGKMIIIRHFNKVKKCMGNGLHKLNQLLKCMTQSVSLSIYKVMILPTLEYVSVVIGSVVKKE